MSKILIAQLSGMYVPGVFNATYLLVGPIASAPPVVVSLQLIVSQGLREFFARSGRWVLYMMGWLSHLFFDIL